MILYLSAGSSYGDPRAPQFIFESRSTTLEYAFEDSHGRSSDEPARQHQHADNRLKGDWLCDSVRALLV